jgi:isoleucyl-tRNA synthetase
MQGIYEKDNGSRVPVKDMSEEIDLHRPFVDHIIFEKDGKVYRRTPEIIDVWFDSGSMPFAQFHYPFENKELFENSFPADFIAEGIDQTRGWFYTLHNIATVLFNKPAFKNIIVNELILDKEGQKMSKSKGNVVFPLEMMDKYGADALRWYFLAVSPPWLPKRFDENGILEVIRKFFTTLYNVYSFFILYGNIDKYNGSEKEVAVTDRPEIDRWILSRMYSVAKTTGDFMEQYDLTKAARTVSDFVIDDLSNWYIRRNRRRFWKSEAGTDKLAAYQTLHEILLYVSRLIAPLAPFLAEEIYLNIRSDSDPESVHLETFPKIGEVEESRVEKELEERMALAQKVVSMVRAMRNEAQTKVRQPLSRVIAHLAADQDRKNLQTMTGIICEEVNVKSLEFADNADDLVTKSAKPNFKILGAKVGKQMGQLTGVIKGFGVDQIAEFEQQGYLNVFIDNHELKLETEDIEILADPKEGFAVQTDQKLTVALDMNLTDELLEEGLAREFVNRVQNFRKEADFKVMDHIIIETEDLTEPVQKAVENQKKYICNETLADDIKYTLSSRNHIKDIEIDEHQFKLGLVKNS